MEYENARWSRVDGIGWSVRALLNLPPLTRQSLVLRNATRHHTRHLIRFLAF